MQHWINEEKRVILEIIENFQKESPSVGNIIREEYAKLCVSIGQPDGNALLLQAFVCMLIEKSYASEEDDFQQLL